MTSSIKPFELLVQDGDVTIELDRRQEDGWIEEIEDVYRFRSVLAVAKLEEKNIESTPTAVEVRSDKDEESLPSSSIASPEVLGGELEDVEWELV